MITPQTEEKILQKLQELIEKVDSISEYLGEKKRYVKPAEAAEILHIPLYAIRNLCDSGVLPSTKSPHRNRENTISLILKSQRKFLKKAE